MSQTATSSPETAGVVAKPATRLPRPVSTVKESPPLVAMDPEFIERNNIVERYFAGSLPVKGATDFERYCHQNPQRTEQLQISERVQAGIRLLAASGQPLPWEEKRKAWWETLPAIIGAGVVALALAIAALVLTSKLSTAQRLIVSQREEIAQRPLLPIKATRTLVVTPDRSNPTPAPVVNANNSSGELIDLKVNVGWSRYSQYRVNVSRANQGQVLQLTHLLRDSNGQLRIALNSSALGPGEYLFTLEGLPMSGPGETQGWFTMRVSH
jgi:hypothetical protein